MSDPVTSTSWDIDGHRAAEFLASGYKQRHFFPHRVYRVPKCGPDGLKIAGRMCGIEDPSAIWELILYAGGESLERLPAELFFDNELVWHQQQFGRVGQVASANVVLDGDEAYSMVHISDLVQRISRRREHKTRVENVFKGWSHMLLNAVLCFALERGCKRVRTPTTALAARHTDRARQVDFTIFERIYDRTVRSMMAARPDGDWWLIELDEARDRIVLPRRCTETRPRAKGVCVFHDIERGLGHRDIDRGFATRADRSGPQPLLAMRQIEADLGVHATYCVVGALMDGLRTDLQREGHCVAFHSFDHRLDRTDQLERCRQVDYRIKGYRPPNSRITSELTDRNMLFHNFEWLACSPSQLGSDVPELRAGLVRLPIDLDDHPLHTGEMNWTDWERYALSLAAKRDFVAIGLHDCYSSEWLHGYRSFLERLRQVGELRTLDEVAAEVTLESGV